MITSVLVDGNALEEACTRSYESGEEVCGAILNGEHIPMANAAAPALRRARFSFDPQEQIDVWKRWGKQGDLIIYHSHPRSAPFPSSTDEAIIIQHPDVFFIIISARDKKACAFRAQDDQVHELVLIATGG